METNYFDIVADVLQGDTLAPYLYIICLDYVLRTSIDLMKENGFKQAKERSKSYPAQTITNVDYADDIANTLPKPKPCYIVWNEQQVTWASMSTQTRLYMCFNQRDDISTLKSGPLKLVAKFTNLRSSVSSTENDINTGTLLQPLHTQPLTWKTDINTWLAKAWTAIDSLSVIWKSDLTDKIKRSCRYYYMDAPRGR